MMDWSAGLVFGTITVRAVDQAILVIIDAVITDRLHRGHIERDGHTGFVIDTGRIITIGETIPIVVDLVLAVLEGDAVLGRAETGLVVEAVFVETVDVAVEVVVDLVGAVFNHRRRVERAYTARDLGTVVILAIDEAITVVIDAVVADDLHGSVGIFFLRLEASWRAESDGHRCRQCQRRDDPRETSERAPRIDVLTDAGKKTFDALRVHAVALHKLNQAGSVPV